MSKDHIQTGTIIFIGLLVCACIVGYDFFARDSIAVYQVDDLRQAESIAQDKVNINTATVEELMKIDGIGEVMATRIVDHRTKYGGFRYLEELKEIKGIGDKTYEKLSDYLAVK